MGYKSPARGYESSILKTEQRSHTDYIANKI